MIIEEYAQLKLWFHWKEIEHVLLKIAALWRAAWIHLILSTQRPDVKVVSGQLKANIGARICFAVASQIDSKVALDEIWAENLVWKGDMLYKNPGHDLDRLQSFYIG
jgi:S-DNA-T family DNA segregation ATPase FtsK/SpoIIIE